MHLDNFVLRMYQLRLCMVRLGNSLRDSVDHHAFLAITCTCSCRHSKPHIFGRKIVHRVHRLCSNSTPGKLWKAPASWWCSIHWTHVCAGPHQNRKWAEMQEDFQGSRSILQKILLLVWWIQGRRHTVPCTRCIRILLGKTPLVQKSNCWFRRATEKESFGFYVLMKNKAAINTEKALSVWHFAVLEPLSPGNCFMLKNDCFY